MKKAQKACFRGWAEGCTKACCKMKDIVSKSCKTILVMSKNKYIEEMSIVGSL